MTKQRGRRRRGCLLGLVLLGLAIVGIGMLLSAAALVGVQGDASSAKDALSQAVDSLRAGRPQAADRQVRSARRHVRDARDSAFGLPGDIWVRLPGAGSAVRDMRHLVSALDHVTAVAGIATRVYPQVTSPRSVNAMLSQHSIDLPRLAGMLHDVKAALPQLQAARSDLDAVRGDAPLIGERLAALRDQAAVRIDPLAEAAAKLKPAISVVPKMLGAGKPIRYLVAFMNPAELRWSGGTVLTATSVTLHRGRMRFGETQDGLDLKANEGFPNQWPAVASNPFHTPGMHRLFKATVHPDWSVSGEELLRAFHAKGLGDYDAVLAIDLPAIAKLFGTTGAVNVPGVGRVDQHNLVKLLAGSYDRFSSVTARKAVNKAVVPVFRDRFLGGGNVIEKAKALGESASGRHLAVYAEDPQLESALNRMGVAGELSDTTKDYLGVFIRTLGGSKSAYWHRRSLSSDVRLQGDGRARVALTIGMQNTAPPYVPQPGFPTDPGEGYFTRLLDSRVLVVLPKGAHPTKVGYPQRAAKLLRGRLGAHPYLDFPVRLPRQSSVKAHVRYDVPHAAIVSGDQMTYRLDYDPQGMVVAQGVVVTLHAPDGWEIQRVPVGWTKTGDRARYRVRADDAGHAWRITLSRS